MRRRARPSTSWLDPDWQAQAEAWARDELSSKGIAVVGSVDQPHVRPWSTVLRLATDAGSVWLKACGTGSGYEPALVQQLAHWCPSDVLTPLGVDRRRALMLLPDGGTTLRSVLAGVFDIDRWQQVLVQYAELQRRLANHVDGLLALDVPDHRPTAMPGLLETLLSNDRALRTSPTESMSAETRARARALQPPYERWCLELADSLIPPTLQHDDLHDGNIMVADDRYRFFDWGDASVAHPSSRCWSPRTASSTGTGSRGEAPRCSCYAMRTSSPGPTCSRERI